MRNVEIERKWTARMVSVAGMVQRIDEGGGCRVLEGGRLVSVKICLPGGDRGDVLLVVKALVAKQEYVGFIGGLDLATALLTWQKKEQRQGLVYRKDQPYQPAG